MARSPGRNERGLLIAGVLLALTAAVGCKREIPVGPGPAVTGYEIQGRVVDQLSNPVPFVEIRLSYSYDFLDSNPAPSKSYTVTDSTAQTTAAVYSLDNGLVKVLFQGRRPVGLFTATWDSTDANGNIVPSGIYRITYLVNNVVEYYYYMVIDGTKVAATDAQGEFTILPSRLPIGFNPIPVYQNDTYQGDYQIDNYVALDFLVHGSVIERDVQVAENEVTEVNLMVQ